MGFGGVEHLTALVPVIRQLRELGATVIKVNGDSLVLAFDSQLPELVERENTRPSTPEGVEDEEAALFDSVDE